MNFLSPDQIADIALRFPEPFGTIILWFLFTAVAFFSTIGFLIILNVVLAWKNGKTEFKKMFSLKKIKFRDLILCSSADCLSIGFAFHIEYLNLQSRAGHEPTPALLKKFSDALASSDLGLFFAAVIALFLLALLEEFIFRSYLIKKADEKNVTFSVIILSSFLFGAGHEAFFPQLVSGMVYSWIFIKYRSVLMTGFLHFLFNLFALRLMSLNFEFLQQYTSPNHLPYIGSIFILIGLLPFGLILRETYQLVGKKDRFVSALFGGSTSDSKF